MSDTQFPDSSSDLLWCWGISSDCREACGNAKYSKKRQLEREDAGLTTEKHQPSHIQLQVLLPAAIDLINLFWKYR